MGLAFPERRRAWLSRRDLSIMGALLAADVFSGFALLTPCRPPALPYLLTTALVIGLIFIARRLPASLFDAPDSGPRRRRTGWIGLAAFAGTVAFFGVSWALPASRLSPWLLFEATGFVATGTGMAIVALTDGERQASPVYRLAMASGALSFFILLAPIQEFGRGAAGMLMVGLSALLLLVWLSRRLRPDLSEASVAPSPSLSVPPRG